MENFNFSSLLEFPGILVLIGVLLLIVAIIIGIASKNNSKKKKKIMEQPAAVAPVGSMPTNELPPILNNVTEDPKMEMPTSENIIPNVEEPVVTPMVEMPKEEEIVPQQPVEQAPVVETPPQHVAYGGANPMDAINASMGVSNQEIKQEPVIPSIVTEPVAEIKEETKDDVETL